MGLEQPRILYREFDWLSSVACFVSVGSFGCSIYLSVLLGACKLLLVAASGTLRGRLIASYGIRELISRLI